MLKASESLTVQALDNTMSWTQKPHLPIKAQKRSCSPKFLDVKNEAKAFQFIKFLCAHMWSRTLRLHFMSDLRAFNESASNLLQLDH